MIREKRYLVLKHNDIENALSEIEKHMLQKISQRVELVRHRNGKAPLECVVVESDWPEFEPTWMAISKRVDGERDEQNLLNNNDQGHDFTDAGCYND